MFILRRSAGFSSTFLAILHAEFVKPRTLLPLAMNKLMHHARTGILGADASHEELSMTVHALNVLRLILLDSVLGSDLGPYLAEASILSLKGFQSPQWAVRNSSMMMFASIVQRTVDNEKHESGGAKATAIHDFFSRFPSLFPFLLQTLTEVLAADTTAATSHPMLFPILLLLSKMRSPLYGTAHTNTAVASELDISLLIPLVRKAAQQRSFKVRQVGAKALASIVPLVEVAFHISCLLCDLFNYRVVSVSTGMEAFKCSTNEMHGILLQVYELLDGFRRHCDCLGDIHLVEAVLLEFETLAHPLLSKFASYIASINCPTITRTYLNILRCGYELVQGHVVELPSLSTITQAFRTELYSLAMSVVDQYLTSAGTAVSLEVAQMPYLALLLKDALYLTISLHSTDGLSDHLGPPHGDSIKIMGMSSLISLHLRHPVSEVREGVLLGLEELATYAQDRTTIDSLLRGPVSVSDLLTMLLDCIQEEKEAPISSLASKVMCVFRRHKAITSYDNGLKELFMDAWPVLNKRCCDKNTDGSLVIHLTSTCAYIIEALGWIIHSYLISDTTGSTREAVICEWLDLLEEASGDDSGPEYRLAAAQSIKASSALVLIFKHFLHTHTSFLDLYGSASHCSIESNVHKNSVGISEYLLRLLLVVFQLMLDDDSEVRACMNEGVADLISDSVVSTGLYDIYHSVITSNSKLTTSSTDDRYLKPFTVPIAPSNIVPLVQVRLIYYYYC